MNGYHTTNATVAQIIANIPPFQLAVAINPPNPIGVGQGCCAIILSTRCVVTAKYPTIPEAIGARTNGINNWTL